MFRGDPSGALGETGLQGNSALDGVNHAAEFGQYAIAHQFENSAVMFFDRWLKQFFVICAKPLEGPRLVALHERGISHDIGGEDCGELPFH